MYNGINALRLALQLLQIHRVYSEATKTLTNSIEFNSYINQISPTFDSIFLAIHTSSKSSSTERFNDLGTLNLLMVVQF